MPRKDDPPPSPWPVGFGSKRWKGSSSALGAPSSGSRGQRMAKAATKAGTKATPKAPPASRTALRLVRSYDGTMRDDENGLHQQRHGHSASSSASSSPARNNGGSSSSSNSFNRLPRSSLDGISAPLGSTSSSSLAVDHARSVLEFHEQTQQMERERAKRLLREEQAAKEMSDKLHREAILGGVDSASTLYDRAFKGSSGSPFYSGPPPGSHPTAYQSSTTGFMSYSRSITSPYFSSTMRQPTLGPWLSSRPAPQLMVGGFRNLGNSCYMNAVLQALLGLPSFMRDVSSSSLMDVKVKPPLQRLPPGDSCFTMLYHLALQRSSAASYRAIDTYDIKSSFGARNSRFRGYQQQDAHEFLCECLNFIHDDVEGCLITSKELQLREELRKRFEAPASPPPKKPAAAAAFAAATSISPSGDPFAFNDDEAPKSPPPRSNAAALPQSASPQPQTECKPAESSPATAASTAPAATSAKGAPPADEEDDELMILESPSQDEEEVDLTSERKDAEDTVPASAMSPASAAGAVSASAGVPSPPAAVPSEPLPALMSPERQQELARQLRQFSPVSLNFDCELRIRLKCQTCGGHERSVQEVFHDFSLDLPAKQPKQLPKPPPKPSPPPSNGKGPLGNVQAKNAQAQDLEAEGHVVSPEFDFDLPDGAAAAGSSSPAPVAPSSGARSPASNAFAALMSADQSDPAPLHLSQLVRSFFDVRVAEYKCVCTGKNEPLEQRPSLSKLPRVLILHLKRFQPNYARGTYEKRTERVLFDQTIDITDFVDEDAEPPPPTEGDETEAADARADRKRKTPAPAAASAAGRSSRSPSPAAKHAKLAPSTPSGSTPAPPAVIQAKKRNAVQVRKVREEHEKECMEIKHDNCVELAIELSALSAELDTSIKAAEQQSRASPAVSPSRPASSAAAAGTPKSSERKGKVTSLMEIDEGSSHSSDEEDAELKKVMEESKAESARKKQAELDDDEQMQLALAASLAEVTSPAAGAADSSSAAAAAAPSSAPLAARSSSSRGSVRHTYELVSVVLHLGETMGSGHYVTHIHEEKKKDANGATANGTGAAAGTATAATAATANGTGGGGKRAPSSSSRVWIKYNDSRVTPLSDSAALQEAQKEGYIFFYAYKPTVATKQTKANGAGKKSAAAAAGRAKH